MLKNFKNEKKQPQKKWKVKLSFAKKTKSKSIIKSNYLHGINFIYTKSMSFFNICH